MNKTKTSASSVMANTEILPVLDEIHNRLMAGETLDLEAYIARFPDQESAIRKYAATMKAVADLGNTLGHPSSPKQSAEPSIGQVGEFSIVREIGRGGMGVVYEATQGTLERRVALKILPFAGLIDDRALKRFHNEARAAAMLHHPNIVPIHSVGNDKGVHYYAMQYIEGPSVADVIRQLHSEDVKEDSIESEWASLGEPIEDDPDPAKPSRQLDTRNDLQAAMSTVRSRSKKEYFRTAAKWIRQAAEALAHAHENGVLHRDIKPANLIVDARHNLWVTDFGLARLESDVSMTATGDLIGTFRFMAPERITGKRVLVDHRADIYALGLTLYELLTLRPAFESDNRDDLLRQIAGQEPRAPRKIDATTPIELELIVAKATEKDPDDRYASAHNLADDLQRFLDNRPIHARRSSLTTRALKWSKRHRSLVGTTVAALLLTLSASMLVLWQAKQRVQSALDEVESKNSELLESQIQLEDSLKIARQALDDVLTEWADKFVGEQPQLSDVQRDILIKAARVYEDLAADHTEDRALQIAAAEAHRKAASIYAELDEKSTARKCYRQALRILERAGAVPENEGPFLEVNARIRAGFIVVDAAPELKSVAEDACQRLEAYVARNPEDLSALRSLADAQNNFGRCCPDQEKRLDYLRRSIDNAETLVHLEGPTKENLTVLSAPMFNYAFLRVDKTFDAFRRQIAVAQQLYDLAPSRYSTEGLARGLTELGHLHFEHGELDEAEDCLLKAIEHNAAIASGFPKRQNYRTGLSMQRYLLARVYKQQYHETKQRRFAELEEQQLGEALRLTRQDKNLGGYYITTEALVDCLRRLDEDGEAYTVFRRASGLALSRDSDTNQLNVFAAGVNLARHSRDLDISAIQTMMRECLLILKSPSLEGTSYQRFQWHDDPIKAERAYVAYLRDAREELRNRPKHVDLLNSISRVQTKGPFHNHSDLEEAFSLIARAHELAPERQAVWSDYGWALYRLGRFDEALNWFTKVDGTVYFEKTPFAAFGLALTKFQLGDVAEGRKYYEIALDQIRPLGAYSRVELTIFREAAAAFDDEATVGEFLKDRWPGIQGYSQGPSRN